MSANASSALEPSMGDGTFLHALRCWRDSHAAAPVDVWGVELAKDTFDKTVSLDIIDASHAINADFMSVKPFQVDAVIGNPPYVRLRNLSPSAAHRALRVTESHLRQPMDPSGSIWMPFTIHATSFVNPGGRLALVLPYESTYVRYGLPLWGFLGEQFGSLRIIRTRRRMFPDLLQEAVILLAAERGGRTDTVLFETLDDVADARLEPGSSSVDVDLGRLVQGDRIFHEAELTQGLTELLNRVRPMLAPAHKNIAFRIGYVSGDKGFFHPDAKTCRKRALPGTSLRSSLVSGRSLRRAGLHTSGVQSDQVANLWLPDSDNLTSQEASYVRLGEKSSIHLRYKCRIREPWYAVPGVRTPDCVLPVFANNPTLMLNDAAYAASNSILCGYLHHGVSGKDLAAAWYTSLTLLEIELKVHALGGGVLVFVPQEAGKIELPSAASGSEAHLTALDECLKSGDPDAAFALGDKVVLEGQLGLSSDDVQAIRDGVRSLRAWRQKRHD